jgi:hypothetical protein
MSAAAVVHGPHGVEAEADGAPIVIPVREILPWTVFIGALCLFLIYVVGLEQGATSLIGGHYLHEWMHDSRHLLGFPCH